MAKTSQANKNNTQESKTPDSDQDYMDQIEARFQEKLDKALSAVDSLKTFVAEQGKEIDSLSITVNNVKQAFEEFDRTSRPTGVTTINPNLVFETVISLVMKAAFDSGKMIKTINKANLLDEEVEGMLNTADRLYDKLVERYKIGS